MKVFYKIIATGFGSGYSPIAPGTAGAIVACGITFLLQLLRFTSTNLLYNSWHVGLIIVFFVLGVLAGNYLEKDWGKDAQKIVVDEMIGVWIALLFIPYSPLNVLLGFILFRIFDIWKPLGVRKMENFKGGLGVMMDDVLAGIYANIVLQIIVRFLI